MNRRKTLAVLAGATVMAEGILRRHIAGAQIAPAPSPPTGPFVQPPLPFLEPQLAPTISNRTVTIHYHRHHAGYYANLNTLTKDTRFASMKLPELIIEANNETDRRIFNNAGQA